MFVTPPPRFGTTPAFQTKRISAYPLENQPEAQTLQLDDFFQIHKGIRSLLHKSFDKDAPEHPEENNIAGLKLVLEGRENLTAQQFQDHPPGFLSRISFLANIMVLATKEAVAVFLRKAMWLIEKTEGLVNKFKKAGELFETLLLPLHAKLNTNRPA